MPEETEVVTPEETEQAASTAADPTASESAAVAGGATAATTASESSTSQTKQVAEVTVTTRSGKVLSHRGVASNEELGAFLQQLKAGGFAEPTQGGMTIYPFHTVESVDVKVFLVKDGLTPSSVVEG